MHDFYTRKIIGFGILTEVCYVPRSELWS